jgi:hypothetical protein
VISLSSCSPHYSLYVYPVLWNVSVSYRHHKSPLLTFISPTYFMNSNFNTTQIYLWYTFVVLFLRSPNLGLSIYTVHVRGSVNINCRFWTWRLGLFDVTNTITLGYNNSHIQLFLGAEPNTAVCIFCTSLLWQTSRFWLLNSASIQVKFKVTLRLTVSQSVSLGVEPLLGLMTRYLLLFDGYSLVFCGASSLTRGRVCLLYILLALASAVFLGSE